jgi:hypothetical protein
MRFNVFMQKDGTAYGVLVCSACNKNVTFELEQQVDLSQFGDGARAISMVGAPKPPNIARKKAGEDTTQNDNTL